MLHVSGPDYNASSVEFVGIIRGRTTGEGGDSRRAATGRLPVRRLRLELEGQEARAIRLGEIAGHFLAAARELS